MEGDYTNQYINSSVPTGYMLFASEFMKNNKNYKLQQIKDSWQELSQPEKNKWFLVSVNMTIAKMAAFPECCDDFRYKNYCHFLKKQNEEAEEEAFEFED